MLANIFPGGSVAKILEERLSALKEETGLIEEDARGSAIETLVADILEAYQKNPDTKILLTKNMTHLR